MLTPKVNWSYLWHCIQRSLLGTVVTHSSSSEPSVLLSQWMGFGTLSRHCVSLCPEGKAGTSVGAALPRAVSLLTGDRIPQDACAQRLSTFSRLMPRAYMSSRFQKLQDFSTLAVYIRKPEGWAGSFLDSSETWQEAAWPQQCLGDGDFSAKQNAGSAGV